MSVMITMNPVSAAAMEEAVAAGVMSVPVVTVGRFLETPDRL